jgi:hypothetical protein
MIEVKVITKRPPKLYRMVRRMELDNAGVKAAAEHVFEGIDPPVATGELASKLQIVKMGPGWYRIVSGAEHSRYVEFGTHDKAPNPYLRRAFRTRGKAARLRYIKAIRRHKR